VKLLRLRPLPVILWLLMGHFIVVHGCARRELLVFDPDLGETRIPIWLLGAFWEGHAIIIEPPDGRTLAT